MSNCWLSDVSICLLTPVKPFALGSFPVLLNPKYNHQICNFAADYSSLIICIFLIWIIFIKVFIMKKQKEHKVKNWKFYLKKHFSSRVVFFLHNYSVQCNMLLHLRDNILGYFCSTWFTSYANFQNLLLLKCDLHGAVSSFLISMLGLTVSYFYGINTNKACSISIHHMNSQSIVCHKKII